MLTGASDDDDRPSSGPLPERYDTDDPDVLFDLFRIRT